VIALQDRELWKKLGLYGGQMRHPNVHRNLHWSLDGGVRTFGFGDLDMDDLRRIQFWLNSNDAQAQSTADFTGWNEHHDSVWQQTPHPMVRVTRIAISFPHRDTRLARQAARGK
jgi:hypothetical protein